MSDGFSWLGGASRSANDAIHARKLTMFLDAGLRNYDLQAVPEYARRVEAIGYDCLWTSETSQDI